MKLNQWLRDRDATNQEFSEFFAPFGTKITVHAVNKWTSGARIPRSREMSIIYTITRGEVSPNDFYSLPPIKKLNKSVK
jgi:hypothetical protein